LHTDEGELLLNLEQVRTVDRILNESVRLVFSETMTVTVRGEKTVNELLSLLANDCVVTDGTPLPAALAKHRPGPRLVD